MMKNKKLYIKITRKAAANSGLVIKDIKGNLVDLPRWEVVGSYVQPLEEMKNAIDAEFDYTEDDHEFTIELTPVFITEEEYEKLPEFTGH